MPKDDAETSHCPLLRHNRCTIYEQRPFICRIYGVAEGIRCPHGCEPERVLSQAEAATLLNEMEELSSLVKLKGI
jgi:Fe-S-cluster containining protein